MFAAINDIAIDFSGARPSVSAMQAAGVKEICRYISPNPNHPKNLTAVERDAYLAGGLGLWLVFENSTLDPLKGGVFGQTHGLLAQSFATRLGYPANVPLYVAVDFDVQPAQMPSVLAYLSAVQAVCTYEIRPYGSFRMIESAFAAGISVGGWQTVAWSYGKRSIHADMLQHATPVHPTVPPLGNVDDNTVLRVTRAWSSQADPQPPPHIGGDMKIQFLTIEGCNAAFLAQTTDDGHALYVSWTGDGSQGRVQQAIADQRAAGMTDLHLTGGPGALRATILLGAVPTGDTRYNWTGDEFLHTVGGQAQNVDQEARTQIATLLDHTSSTMASLANLKQKLLVAGQ